MSTRFRVDLLHPGEGLRHIGWVAKTWEEWFTGPNAARRLAFFAVGSAAVLLVILGTLILPAYWRLSSDLSDVPGLRRDLASRKGDLDLLTSNLGALTAEARRQVRWAELMAALSQEIPPTIKLQSVEGVRVAPTGTAAPQPGTQPGFENNLRIDAVTPVRPGSPPLLEVAQFMGGLMRDPAVNKRFQLKSWELKPGGDNLNISIVLTERGQ